MKTKLALLIVAAAFLPAVLADIGADWQKVSVSFSWDLSMGGPCANETQCLLHVLGNESYDGDISRWFTIDNERLWPRCVNNTQSILDYVCENGNWTTRTKRLAFQLAQETSPDNYTLFCDSYASVLNKYDYLVKNVLVEEYLGNTCNMAGKQVPCINSICVLKTPATIAVGTTLNVPVNHTTRSFLLALNKNSDLCRNVNPAATGFVSCGSDVWYSPSLNAVVYLPNGYLSLPTAGISEKISGPMNNMSYYVMQILHKPGNPGMNFLYFPRTRLFNHIYFAQNGNRAVFGFLEKNLKPEYTILPYNESSPVPIDYIGVRYSNINLGKDPCLNLVKVYDTRAFCENQTGSGFNIIARHRCEPGYEGDCLEASPIVKAWPALTGKLRP
ncbi:MAG: hypothetical protein QXT19_00830 [Candidatus Woesearchaeota archaeon]